MPNRSDVTRSRSLILPASLSLIPSLSLSPSLLLSLLEKQFRFRAQSLVENLVRCSLRSNCCVYVKLQPVEACRLNENENGKWKMGKQCKTVKLKTVENESSRKTLFCLPFFSASNFALCVVFVFRVFLVFVFLLSSAVFLVFLATLFTRQCCFTFFCFWSARHIWPRQVCQTEFEIRAKKCGTHFVFLPLLKVSAS